MATKRKRKRKQARNLGITAGLLTALGSISAADAFERQPISQINLSDHHVKQGRPHQARHQQGRSHPATGYYYFPEDVYQRYPDRTYCGHLGKGCGEPQYYHRSHHHRSR